MEHITALIHRNGSNNLLHTDEASVIWTHVVSQGWNDSVGPKRLGVRRQNTVGAYLSQIKQHSPIFQLKWRLKGPVINELVPNDDVLLVSWLTCFGIAQQLAPSNESYFIYKRQTEAHVSQIQQIQTNKTKSTETHTTRKCQLSHWRAESPPSWAAPHRQNPEHVADTLSNSQH